MKVSVLAVSLLSALSLAGCGVAKSDTMPATDNPAAVSAPAAAPALPSTGSSKAPVRQDVDVSIFYDRLSPYGRWTSDDQYGDVWLPSGVEAGWRPYNHGYWSN